MTKIKLCGLGRAADIAAANSIGPEFIGFVFAKKSRRYVSPEVAEGLKSLLREDIMAVGVFVDEDISVVKDLLDRGVIDVAQLHGAEDEVYIKRLKDETGKQVIKAFKIGTEEDIKPVEASPADFVLLDAGAGDGKVFDWSLVKNVKREYFLAGGLNPDNVGEAVKGLRPFAVDVSSGIETDGFKDEEKMVRFAEAVRKAGGMI